MKKTLIALAAVAATGAAFAQNVTLSGNFAVTLRDSMLVGSQNSTLKMDDARVQFNVSEDLGGGITLKAHTRIESNNGRSDAVVGQDHSIAVSSAAFGTVALKNYLAGSNNLSAGISADTEMEHIAGGYVGRNRLQWDLPEMMKGLGVTLKWTQDKVGVAVGTPATELTDDSFDKFGFDISYALSGLPLVVTASGNSDDNLTDMTFEYNAGFAKFALWTDRNGDDKEFTMTGALSPAWNAGLHIIDYGNEAKGWGAQATYAISKRTSLNLSYVDADLVASTDANFNATASKNRSGISGTNYSIKVNHSF